MILPTPMASRRPSTAPVPTATARASVPAGKQAAAAARRRSRTPGRATHPRPGGWRPTSFPPPVPVPPPPTGAMSRACQAAPYNCLQVIITEKIENYLMGVLGVPITYSTTLAVAYAQPPQNSYNVPPPTALYLYEPGWNCTGPQCFNAGAAPSRSQLSCR